ncbi:MAG: hypothetical protein K1000chlam3_01020 [Chlamydiae bacterium]|nr:hypothetical protein [Chlamydiota bacterium]
MRLLHEKSEHKNEKSERFYSGNIEAEMVPYGGGELLLLSPSTEVDGAG